MCCILGIILPSYYDHYQDPYEPMSTMEYHETVFVSVAHMECVAEKTSLAPFENFHKTWRISFRHRRFFFDEKKRVADGVRPQGDC